MKSLALARKLVLALALGAATILAPSAQNTLATGSGNYVCGTFTSFISGTRVHAETFKSGTADCYTHKARARAFNVYSSWDVDYTHARASLTKDPSSNGGTHQFCVSAGSCATRYS